MASSLSSIRVRYYTNSEIRTLGVVKVEHASTYDRGVPKTDGINDARMGLIDHTIRCPTCFKANCDQHFGYIELAKPVYRLGSINTVLLILRAVCRECAMPKFALPALNDSKKEVKGLIQLSCDIVAMAPSREKLRSVSDACRSKLSCPHCLAPQPNYVKRFRTFLDATYRAKELGTEFVKQRGPEYQSFLKSRFMADDAAAVLHSLKQEVIEFLGLDRPSNLMCHLQIVPPPIIRPSNFVGLTKVRSENDMTMALQDVVRANLEFRNALGDPLKPLGDLEALYDKVQIMVSGIVNHAIKRAAAQKGLLPLVTATSKRKVIDLKCRLNGKKARLRGNLSGKRVDQSGRTVISGDASHDIDELGIPSVMMNKLTFPEPVTSINMAQMAACILQGAYADNGALAVRPPSHALNHVIWLPMLDREARIDLASQIRPGWTVERHLVNGDWVLFNRQPSLWKASMMAFRVYRVSGLTARLPLPVTRAFNADFDGDEMNIHALQGYEAIAEAQELMSVSHQIVTPQSNSVIIGLVQDSLVGAWRLSAQDCFFTYEEALDLLTAVHYECPSETSALDYSDLSLERPKVFRNLVLPNPSVQYKDPKTFRWKSLWTGKQLISLILPRALNLSKKAPWEDLTGPSGLEIRHGLLLTGRLAKTHLGAASTGIVHAVWRHYGPGGAHKFISDAQRLFVKHLAHDGPTQSIVDCLMGCSEEKTLAILSSHLSRSDKVLGLSLSNDIKEAKSSSVLQETLRSVGASVLSQIRPESALANCVNSGSKGNVMNIAQISGCVGQQTVYGRRVPMRQTRLGQRTLIYYAPNDFRAEARGFVSNSYMSGLSPSEFFAHQMAGREGIVATAVNTSESGYNQRRMIKGQESQCVGYDGTVRVSSNIIIQTSYGGDDLDGSRLERIALGSLDLKDYKVSLEAWATRETQIIVERAYQKCLRFAVWRANLSKVFETTFPCAVNVKPFLDQFETATQASAQERNQAFQVLFRETMLIHKRLHSSTKTIFNVSVACFLVQVSRNPVFLNHVPSLLELYNKAIIAPGEGVGALGASSIGEPSMQMTLNVFHYSGIADKNVTITGLPRFKQLINSVDTYENANMTAELVSYEYSGLQVSCVNLHDIGRVTGHSVVPRPSAFALFGPQRGSFYAKFEAPEESRDCIQITIELDWLKCARYKVDPDCVAKSLRETFGFDAIVELWPIWSKDQSSFVKVTLGPWIRKDSVGPICEGLQNQLRLRGIDYIKNAITFQDTFYEKSGHPRSRHIVETEGSNVIDLAKCSLVKAETIRTTNIVEVCNILGISAGIVVLQAELHKVLSFDSAYIDPRHTWLLADTMGRSGTLGAMNRHHMESMGSSLLQRASFEQSLDVFEEGAAFGREDPLTGATERIITGQPVCIGTGLVGIVDNGYGATCGSTLIGSASHELPEVLVGPMPKMQHTDENLGVGPLNQSPPHSGANAGLHSGTLDNTGHSASNAGATANGAGLSASNAGASASASGDSVKAGRVAQPSLHVRSMHFRPIELNLGHYNTRLLDMDRIASDAFLEECTTRYRVTAAQKRTLPTLQIRIDLREAYYKQVLNAYWTYGLWTSTTSSHLITEVTWTHKSLGPNQFGFTKVEKPGDSKSYIFETFWSKVAPPDTKYLGMRCEIISLKLLEPLQVPFGVEATQIVMRQQATFTKGPFRMTLGKQWTGTTNVEVEKQIFDTTGVSCAILEVIDAENILQNRCTDAQLANALALRMP